MSAKTDYRVFRWRSLYNIDVVSSGCNYVNVHRKHTVVGDIVLPMGELSTERVPKVLKREAHSNFLRYVRDDPISEERPHFRLGTVADGENLERHPRLVQGHAGRYFGTDLAVLHHVSFPQPSLVEWFTRGMDDMTQPVLFRQHEHSVK